MIFFFINDILLLSNRNAYNFFFINDISSLSHHRTAQTIFFPRLLRVYMSPFLGVTILKMIEDIKKNKIQTYLLFLGVTYKRETAWNKEALYGLGKSERKNRDSFQQPIPYFLSKTNLAKRFGFLPPPVFLTLLLKQPVLI